MNWNELWHDHYRYEGKHAMLSPSNPAWLNYDDVHMAVANSKWAAAERGTKLHALAKQCIDLHIYAVSESTDILQKTFGLYVADCINNHMRTEQVLVYSPRAFGTADAIHFNPNDGCLKVFDLKTGTTAASFRQLEVYAALFTLEYRVSPIVYDLRIYQNGSIRYEAPSPAHITGICNKIIHADEMLLALTMGDEYGDTTELV